jgi:hypothetical protein
MIWSEKKNHAQSRDLAFCSCPGWHSDDSVLSSGEKKASRVLHTQTLRIVEQVFALIMDRATVRELDTFTMHDQVHGRKVAHLMWHILETERRKALTPPEIGMLIIAAHLHDAGMALSRAEREKRLAPDSDLWDRAEASTAIKRNLDQLREIFRDPQTSEFKRISAENELFQAEEALLALDTRERHASRERYQEMIEEIREYHDQDRTRIPDIEECFSFDGDSFRDKLVDICVSHNQDAGVLVEKDIQNLDRSRFPHEYPIGRALVDTQLVAAALRLADVLDFDRERTPATLFHYLVPASLINMSALEWSKHLSISNWEIRPSEIAFRGRCKNHVVHHAVVQFCALIAEEIASTRATFEITGRVFPFALPTSVKAEIHEEGYHYVPYRFELDDSRVYELLMGGAIYDNPLVALRELIQNAVDACKYRDAQTKLVEPHFIPDTENRINIRYEEPIGERNYPILHVCDTGAGMDQWVIERWFLKVGRSFYTSTEFARDRAQFRKKGIDFAPVSEFGIGFLSSFLLADRVDVETAMWEPLRGDTRKRHLQIDGPTRLIRIREDPNAGLQRLKGTRISLALVRGGQRPEVKRESGPSWKELRAYVAQVCQELPYRLNLDYVTSEGVTTEALDPKPLIADVPEYYSQSAVRIPIRNFTSEGEIAIVPYAAVKESDRDRFRRSAIELPSTSEGDEASILLRGGFRVGHVPGLPRGFRGAPYISARVRLLWDKAEGHNYQRTNLARNNTVRGATIASSMVEGWLRYLLDNTNALLDGFIYGIDVDTISPFGVTPFSQCTWLEKYDALSLYHLARNGWSYERRGHDDRPSSHGLDRPNIENSDPVSSWENGAGPAKQASYLSKDLLDLILPLVVAERVYTKFGAIHLMPPQPDWRDKLASCRNFISKPVRWPRFITYYGDIEERLYHEWGNERLFNIKYASVLDGFSDQELHSLAKLFEKLLDDRHGRRPSHVGEEQAALLALAADTVGGLEVSSVNGVAKVAEFRQH